MDASDDGNGKKQKMKAGTSKTKYGKRKLVRTSPDESKIQKLEEEVTIRQTRSVTRKASERNVSAENPKASGYANGFEASGKDTKVFLIDEKKEVNNDASNNSDSVDIQNLDLLKGDHNYAMLHKSVLNTRTIGSYGTGPTVGNGSIAPLGVALNGTTANATTSNHAAPNEMISDDSASTAADPTAADPTAADPTAADPIGADSTAAVLNAGNPIDAFSTTANPIAADSTAADPIAEAPNAVTPSVISPLAAGIGNPASTTDDNVHRGIGAANAPTANATFVDIAAPDSTTKDTTNRNTTTPKLPVFFTMLDNAQQNLIIKVPISNARTVQVLTCAPTEGHGRRKQTIVSRRVYYINHGRNSNGAPASNDNQ